jgi:hypothetical protein
MYLRQIACLRGDFETFSFESRPCPPTESLRLADILLQAVKDPYVPLDASVPETLKASGDCPYLNLYAAAALACRPVINRPPIATAAALLHRRPLLPAEPVSAEALNAAAHCLQRQPSAFEQQLLAMNQLRQDGEPALAVIGSLALVEWFLNDALADRRATAPDGRPRQESLWTLLAKGASRSATAWRTARRRPAPA